MRRRPRIAFAATLIAAALLFVLASMRSSSFTHPGKRVYDASCASCHEIGAHGAPRAGDAGAWAPRLEAGSARLYAVALKGKVTGDHIMPPRGGDAKLTDAEVKRAVDYLVSRADRGVAGGSRARPPAP